MGRLPPIPPPLDHLSVGPTTARRSRGRLPHWERQDAIYAVTFRLFDSLPQHVLAAYALERETIVDNAARMHRELTTFERTRLWELFSVHIDGYLHRGVGACWLRKREVGQMVWEALAFFAGKRYDLFARCVMPNHVHVVFRPLRGNGLDEILHSWKSFTAKQANQLLVRAGEFWQREYYDHWVRDAEEFWRIVRYVANNPRVAGVAGWPWVEVNLPGWTREGDDGLRR